VKERETESPSSRKKDKGDEWGDDASRSLQAQLKLFDWKGMS
jgi:hypothetical protein